MQKEKEETEKAALLEKQRVEAAEREGRGAGQRVVYEVEEFTICSYCGRRRLIPRIVSN